MEAARRLYRTGQDDKKLKAFGLESAVAAEEPVDILPDCWESLRVFTAMRTQWRYVSCGMAGFIATGLDYGVLPEIWERTEVPKKRRNTVFHDLIVMESAAMAVINEKT